MIGGVFMGASWFQTLGCVCVCGGMGCRETGVWGKVMLDSEHKMRFLQGWDLELDPGE